MSEKFKILHVEEELIIANRMSPEEEKTYYFSYKSFAGQIKNYPTKRRLEKTTFKIYPKSVIGI